jgi:hypothetical protein
MTTDRDQFEAWIRSKYPIADFERGNDGGYIVADLESRWESWQAANALMRQYADRNPFMTIGHFAEHVAARAAPAQSGSKSNAESVGQTRNMVPGKFPMHAGGITGNDSAPAQREEYECDRIVVGWVSPNGNFYRTRFEAVQNGEQTVKPGWALKDAAPAQPTRLEKKEPIRLVEEW